MAALRAWKIAGGYEWGGIDVAIDVLGVRDIETLIFDLNIIRDHA